MSIVKFASDAQTNSSSDGIRRNFPIYLLAKTIPKLIIFYIYIRDRKNVICTVQIVQR